MMSTLDVVPIVVVVIVVVVVVVVVIDSSRTNNNINKHFIRSIPSHSIGNSLDLEDDCLCNVAVNDRISDGDMWQGYLVGYI